MRKKAILLCLLSLLMTMGAMAQQERNVVYTAGLGNLEYTKKEVKQTAGKVIGEVLTAVVAGQSTQQMEGYEGAVRAAVLKGISQARRVKGIDGQLSEEEAAQPHTWYVDGTISNIASTSKIETYEDKDKKRHSRTYYKGVIGVTLHFKDAHTDQVLFSPAFNVTASDLSWVETAEGALNNALGSLASQITRYLNLQLPLAANIVEGARERKDKQKEVYIDLGASHGMREGVVLLVYRDKVIAGKKAREEIARLKVKKVEGDEVSLCKVTSRGKDLKAALDAGDTLIIETK